MSTDAGHTTHLDDGVLVRRLDGEASAEERRRADTHLAACARCRSRLETLRVRSAAFSGMLRATAPALPEPPVRVRAAVDAAMAVGGGSRGARQPARWQASPLLRAAVIVFVLLGAGLTVKPVRAWVGERLVELAGVLLPEPQQRPPDAAAEGAVIAFTPETRDLVFRFDAAGTGTARFGMGEDTRLTAQSVGAGLESTLLVLRDGVRVQAPAGSGADYRFTLPRGTRSVRIVVAGTTVANLGGADPLPREWSISLAEAGRR